MKTRCSKSTAVPCDVQAPESEVAHCTHCHCEDLGVILKSTIISVSFTDREMAALTPDFKLLDFLIDVGDEPHDIDVISNFNIVVAVMFGNVVPVALTLLLLLFLLLLLLLILRFIIFLSCINKKG